VDHFEIVLGVDSMGLHQPVQRRAMIAVIGLLKVARRFEIELGDLHHITGDSRIDLGEQIALTRIKRVVEVEHPVCDVVEIEAGGYGRRVHVVHDPIMPQIDEWEMTVNEGVIVRPLRPFWAAAIGRHARPAIRRCRYLRQALPNEGPATSIQRAPSARELH
jgi:hypothetical protein